MPQRLGSYKKRGRLYLRETEQATYHAQDVGVEAAHHHHSAARRLDLQRRVTGFVEYSHSGEQGAGEEISVQGAAQDWCSPRHHGHTARSTLHQTLAHLPSATQYHPQHHALTSSAFLTKGHEPLRTSTTLPRTSFSNGVQASAGRATVTLMLVFSCTICSVKRLWRDKCGRERARRYGRVVKNTC